MSVFDDNLSIGNRPKWEIFWYLVSICDFKAAFFQMFYRERKPTQEPLPLNKEVWSIAQANWFQEEYRLAKFLQEGWQPFGVDRGTVYLRKNTSVPAEYKIETVVKHF